MIPVTRIYTAKIMMLSVVSLFFISTEGVLHGTINTSFLGCSVQEKQLTVLIILNWVFVRLLLMGIGLVPAEYDYLRCWTTAFL